jgi:hypothetical protein
MGRLIRCFASEGSACNRGAHVAFGRVMPDRVLFSATGKRADGLVAQPEPRVVPASGEGICLGSLSRSILADPQFATYLPEQPS